MQVGFSQSNLSWQSYFSFNEIKDISSGSTSITAASENALFAINTASSEIKTTTTVDGLSGETISALYYSKTFDKTIIGYVDGLLTVVDQKTGKILKVVDVLTKQLPSNIKGVNHFMEYEGIIYISCDFGIVQFNLNTMLFGDTYYIGDNGAQTRVAQTTIFNGYIYAATSTGVKKALVTNKNLIDYTQWELIISGDWVGVEAFDTELIAVSTSGSIYKFEGNSVVLVRELSQVVNDVRVSEDYLLITGLFNILVYNKQLQLIRQIDFNQVLSVTTLFTCATIIDNVIYFGTKENGLYTTPIAATTTFEYRTPTGPSRNNIFALDVAPNSLWAVYGSYNFFYNPFPKKSYGVSKYSDVGWLNIPFEKVLDAKSIVRVAINPNNENVVYMGSFDTGMLKIENDIPVLMYNSTNSTIEPIPNTSEMWINGLAFDKEGSLWLNNSQVNVSVKYLTKNNEWKAFSLQSVLVNANSAVYGRITVDKNGAKWVAINNNGIVGFNEKKNIVKKIIDGADFGNLPTIDARVAAEDNNGQLWIGTTKGLRVLSNVNSLETDNILSTKPIIILEDGLAQELFFEQFITDIVVDGANNKWVGTADSGIFLVSPDGQKTLYHFTTSNSPLPSNSINDIAIRGTTGEVFISTTKGMVSFKGSATKASGDLTNVYIYPNPVRPDYQGTVKIGGLLDKANVKITDIAGNLVYETISEGGTIEWDTTAFGKYKVATGVYMVFISADDGIETKVKKLMIVR